MTGRRWPDAALFDLDGTLVDREPLMTEAVRRVFVDRGTPLADDWLGSSVGRAWTDVFAELTRTLERAWSFDEFIAVVFDQADELLADGFPTRVLDGGRALVERLASRDVPIAVVTGSLRREVPAALRHAGVDGLVSVVVAAEDYAPGKPAPECYLLAARLLGVGPERCVVFEDSTPGVAAGLAAGMRVIATEDANPPAGHPANQDLSAAHHIVPTLAAVDDDHLRFPA